MSEMVTASSREVSEREVSVHGCMVIVNGTTAGLEFGIDAFSWSLGNRFAGIYGVSKGLHLLVFGAGSHGAGREGVWVDLTGVVAKRWDTVQERLGDDGASIATPEAALVHAQRVASVPEEAARHGFGQYPPDHLHLWQSLSSHIDQSTLERCGIGLDAAFGPGPSGEEGDDEEPDGRYAKWTAIATRRERLLVSKSASELSTYNLDGSERLRALIATYNDWRGVIGELELCYVTFIALGSLGALRQWQRLVALLCSCDSIIAEGGPLVTALSAALNAQLSIFTDRDFFRDPLSKSEDVVRPALLALFETGSLSQCADTRLEVAALQRMCLDRFGELVDDDYTAQTTDDAPAMVSAEDLDAATRRLELQSSPEIRTDPLAAYPALAEAMLPAEDALMAAARLLDDPGNPEAMADARRFLLSQADDEI